MASSRPPRPPMISAVVPAYNEEERIAATVDAVLRVPGVDEVIVVDDGSSDQTAACAEKAGARVVCLTANSGKGAALNAGVKASTGDVIVVLDADLGECAIQADKLIAPVASGEADMTIATFPVIPGKGGGFGFVVKMARNGIHRRTGREMVAPLSGQRAMKREVWEKVGGFAGGFGAEVALTIDALCAGFRVLEVPTTMTHRVTGRDWKAVRHRTRQFLAVARALWARRGRQCR